MLCPYTHADTRFESRDLETMRRDESRPCKLKILRHDRPSSRITCVAQARGLQGRVSTRLIAGMAGTSKRREPRTRHS